MLKSLTSSCKDISTERKRKNRSRHVIIVLFSSCHKCNISIWNQRKRRTKETERQTCPLFNFVFFLALVLCARYVFVDHRHKTCHCGFTPAHLFIVLSSIDCCLWSNWMERNTQRTDKHNKPTQHRNDTEESTVEDEAKKQKIIGKHTGNLPAPYCRVLRLRLCLCLYKANTITWNLNATVSSVTRQQRTSVICLRVFCGQTGQILEVRRNCINRNMHIYLQCIEYC